MATSAMLAAAGAVLAASAAAIFETSPEQHGARGAPHDDTGPITAALASCAGHADGCRVVFARSYLSGPLRVNASRVELSITGTLAMLPRAQYPSAEQGPFLSNAPGVSALRITGGGLVDGNGHAWWPCKYLGCWRPHLMAFDTVHGLSIGPLRMQNPPVRASSCLSPGLSNV